MADKSEAEKLAELWKSVGKDSRKMLKSWKVANELIDAGVLVRQSNGWYRLTDPAAFDKISMALQAFRQGKDRKVSHVKLARLKSHVPSLEKLAKLK